MKIWGSIQMYCLWVFEKVKMSGMPSYFKVVYLLTRDGERATKRKRKGERVLLQITCHHNQLGSISKGGRLHHREELKRDCRREWWGGGEEGRGVLERGKGWQCGKETGCFCGIRKEIFSGALNPQSSEHIPELMEGQYILNFKVTEDKIFTSFIFIFGSHENYILVSAQSLLQRWCTGDGLNYRPIKMEQSSLDKSLFLGFTLDDNNGTWIKTALN